MSLQEVIKRIRRLDEPSKEEATILQIVLPILHELGWDFTDPAQVEPQHTLGATDDSAKAGRVDIGLLGLAKGKQPPEAVALIEVKKSGTNLKKNLGQMVRYAFDASAPIFALTNGYEWWLFLPHETGSSSIDRRFAVLDLRQDRLQKLVDEFTVYLARSELTTQRAERQAKKILRTRRDPGKARRDLQKGWDKLLASDDHNLTDAVASVIFNKINQRAEHEQIIALLRQSGLPATKASDTASSVAEASATPSKKASQSTKSDRPKKPSALILFGDLHPVKTWAEVLVKVAEQLHSQHAADFDRALNLGSEQNPLIARRKQDIKRAAKEISGSNSIYWIGTGHNRDRIIYWCHELLKKFGYSSDELQIE